MNWNSLLPRPHGVLLLTLGSAAGGAAIGYHYRNEAFERRQQEYQRQLDGALTERERQIEALSTELGLTHSLLVKQGTLEQQYKAQLTQKDEAFEKFRQEHGLKVQSLSSSLFALRQRLQGGTTQVQEAPPTPEAGEGGRPAISYEYTDTEGRVHLVDPDIWVQGNERLELTQRFQVKGTVMQQTDGSLMAERVQLVEVAPGAGGPYRELAEAKLVDASFTYANAPQEGPSSSDQKALSGMVTVGTSFQTSHPLRFGPSVRLALWDGFGLAAGLSSNFRSLEGSGGDLVLTYTPTLRGRELGLALGAGVYLPIGGTTRIRPNLTLSFIVY